MSKNLLSFLKQATVEEVAPSKASGGSNAPKKQRNPNPALVAIRVWRDGSIFPSQLAVEKFDLAYREAVIKKVAIPLKDGETPADQRYRNEYSFPSGSGNGLDLIDTRLWQQFKTEENGGMLMVAVVGKQEGKVDMFSSVAYDEAGKPKLSVMDQGVKTFGSEVLIPAIEDLYGITFAQPAKPAVEAVPAKDGKPAVPAQAAVPAVEGVQFVDMVIFEELGEGEDKMNITEKYSTKFVYVPKRITRGESKGKSDYVRREDVKVYGFAPVQLVQPGMEDKAADGEPGSGEDGEDKVVDLTNATMEERNAVLNS